MKTMDDTGAARACLWLAALWAVAATMAAAACEPAAAQTDGSSPPAVITWTGGDLPSLSGDGQAGGRVHGEGSIQVSQRSEWTHHHHATPIGSAGIGLFRHYRHEGGPQSCLFTANATADGFLKDVGGGRDCPRADGDPRCGFISEAYFAYALAGGTCESFNILPCTGAFCW